VRGLGASGPEPAAPLERRSAGRTRYCRSAESVPPRLAAIHASQAAASSQHGERTDWAWAASCCGWAASGRPLPLLVRLQRLAAAAHPAAAASPSAA